VVLTYSTGKRFGYNLAAGKWQGFLNADRRRLRISPEGERRVSKTMSFWLILVLGSNVPGLHVGNYETLATCEAAAKKAIFINPRPRIAEPFYGSLCIQANGASTKPPS
jgi:hypothetical protein